MYYRIGLGRAQYLSWLLTGLVVFCDYVQFTLPSVILPPLRCNWQLTTTFETAITTAVLVASIVSALLFGNLADKYGRKTIMVSTQIIFIFGVAASALAPNKWVFLVSRLVIGGCIGLNMSVNVCYATEFAESRCRAYGMTVFAATDYIAVAATAGLAFLLLRIVGWRLFIIIASAPTVLVLLLALYLPESPRFLLVMGDHDGAVDALRQLAWMNGKELPEGLTVKLLSPQRADNGSFKRLFNEEYRRSTITLTIMFFHDMFIHFGFIFLLPLLYRMNACGTSPPESPTRPCQILSQNDLAKLTFASAVGVLGNSALILAVLIGRLIPLRGTNAILVFLFVGLFFCISLWVTFSLTVGIKLMEATLNMLLWIIIPERYPTNIRSTATSFINSMGKLGGVLGSALPLLFYIHPYYALGTLLLSSLIGLIASFAYDVETKDVELQDS